MPETNFQSYKDVKFLVGSAAKALGTAHANSDTWEQLRCSAWTIPMLSAPLQVGENNSGHYAQVESQGQHRDDTSVYEATATFEATATSILAITQGLFGDASSAAALTAALTPGNMSHSVSHDDVNTLLWENAGSDATKIDLSLAGAFPVSMTIKGDLGTNAGIIQVDVTWFSGYRPLESAFAAPSSITLDTANAYNMFINAATVTVDSQPYVCTGFEVTITRTLERVLFIDVTDFNPYGYAQTTPWEVTGSITAKRDDSIEDGLAMFKGNSVGVPISIGGGNLTLSMPDAMLDTGSVDSGAVPMLVTLPFRAFAASTTASIIDITCT